jgi:hypothetical protein
VKFTFNPKKSTQAAASLLKSNDGDMDKYLWIKMLYLADRASLEKWEESITGDSAASMPYGPVLSTIYDLTKGDCSTLREYWERYISDADPETNRVFLKDDPGVDELSKAEIGILESVFAKFHGYSWSQMRDFCHSLPEYEDVGKGSKPIEIDSILKALGKTDDQIRDAKNRCVQIQVAEMLLARQ